MAKKKTNRRKSAAPTRQVVTVPAGKASTKRPPGSSRAPRGASSATTAASPSAEKVAEGQNRQARKEEARRHREAIRRQMARRRIYRRVAVVGGSVLVVVALGFLVSRTGGGELTGEQQSLLDRADQAATAAGCDQVQTITAFDPADQDQTHVGGPNGPPTMPPFSSYPSTPPVSGPHGGGTLPANIYDSPPPMDQALHSLEHGAAIVWYSPDASADELAEIQTFFRENQDHVIVAPYNYPDQGAQGTLPSGKRMALASWHHVRYCENVSLPVAFAFARNYATAEYSDYRGDAPEAGLPI
ncbi:hypothetical protein BH20ACT24_BH20ACT24_09570 [soil metagenome]